MNEVTLRRRVAVLLVTAFLMVMGGSPLPPECSMTPPTQRPEEDRVEPVGVEY